MKSASYLAVLDPHGSERGHEQIARATSKLGLQTRLASGPLTLLSGPGEPPLRTAPGAAIMGRCFRGMEPISSEALARDCSTGQAMVATCWGDYVGFFVDHPSRSVNVLRSPSGGLAALRAEAGPLTLVASDISILLALGAVRPALDWTFVAHHLAFPHLRGALTGISHVGELFAGDLTTFSASGEERTCLWSPWHFAQGSTPIEDLDEAALLVRQAVRSSTEALASGYDRILLELSGGLDSSIIAASLARTTAHVTAVNLVTPTAEGDERRYARQVASQAGFDLVELPAAPEIDMTAPPSARLVRPSGLPGVLRAWEDRFADEARRRDVQAFFGGTGGDNVFCALGSAAPAADALRSHGPGSAFFHAVRDVAGIHGSTFWSVLLMAWHQARRPPPDPPWPRSLLFTNEDAMPRLPQFHPWLDEPAGAPPGSRSHVRSIMAAQAHLDGYARHAVAPSAFPLLSQPVMEACLRIPSWLWVQGAIDRAVARAAFRDHLPAAVAARRTKGMMNAYCTRVYEQNRPALRTLLLDGRLAAAGLIDRTTLGRYLDTDAPVCDILFYRVLELADVEVWARSWLDD